MIELLSISGIIVHALTVEVFSVGSYDTLTLL